MPIVSVIIPVYKTEPYLNRCVDSILGQTFSDIELILVDDGSPDNCSAICDEYAAKDSRVVVIHQENAGPSVARNAALNWIFENSDSQWISCVDSDDWVHPEYIERLYHAVKSTDTLLGICGYVRTLGEEPAITEEQMVPRLWDPETFFVERNVNAIIPCGKLYQRELLQKFRYPAGKIHEDEFITHKILFTVKQIVVIDAKMYFYFQNKNSIMGVGWSPKRLVALNAFRARLFFFKSHGLKRAYEWNVDHYLFHACNYMNHLDRCPDDVRKKYIGFVRRHLRASIRHGRRLGMIPFRGNEHWYEKAYPLPMRLYWNWKGLCEKIKSWK